MFSFTDDEREAMNWFRALTTDAQGREVLVGLTLAETEFLMEHRRKFRVGIRDHENKRMAQEFTEKHEKARLEVIGTEIYMRNFNPTRQ